MRRRRLTFACVVAALVATGCGEGELAPKRDLPANTVLVTQEDIDKYPPRSPQRTLMTWWRAMQYTDARGYLARLATPLRKARLADGAHRAQLPVIARQVDDVLPHITRVSIRGKNATVYTELEFRQLVGADKYATTRVPQAFSLKREDRTWGIADDLFVEAGVRGDQRAQAQRGAKDGVRSRAGRSKPGAAALPSPSPPAETTTTPER